jgi:hypothetical protein
MVDLAMCRIHIGKGKKKVPKNSRISKKLASTAEKKEW